MLNRRRLLLSVPLLAAPSLVHGAPAWAREAAPVWAREVAEVRFAAAGPGAAELAPGLRRRLGVVVRPVPVRGGALVRALDRGHLEFALLDRQALAAAQGRMGPRLVTGATRSDGLTPVARRVLPAPMRQDLVAALA